MKKIFIKYLVFAVCVFTLGVLHSRGYAPPQFAYAHDQGDHSHQHGTHQHGTHEHGTHKGHSHQQPQSTPNICREPVTFASGVLHFIVSQSNAILIDGPSGKCGKKNSTHELKDATIVVKTPTKHADKWQEVFGHSGSFYEIPLDDHSHGHGNHSHGHGTHEHSHSHDHSHGHGTHSHGDHSHGDHSHGDHSHGDHSHAHSQPSQSPHTVQAAPPEKKKEKSVGIGIVTQKLIPTVLKLKNLTYTASKGSKDTKDGHFAFYSLKSGALSLDPKIVFGSRSADPNGLELGPNAHVHYGVIFSKAGKYELDLVAESADTASPATHRLVFEVGDAQSTQSAPAASKSSGETKQESSALGIGIGILIAIVVIAIVSIIILRRKRSKRSR